MKQLRESKNRKRLGLMLFLSLVFALMVLDPSASALAGNKTQPPAPPSGLVARADDHSVMLTWNKNKIDTRLLLFVVEYKKSEALKWESVTITDFTATSYTVKGLLNNQRYKFRVKVENTSLLWSKYTNEVRATPADDSLKDLKVGGATIAGFSPDTLTYDVLLPSGTTVVPKVTATVNDAKATAKVANAKCLPGCATVVVTAPPTKDCRAQRTYTINFLLPLTVSFNSNGGSAIAPIYPYKGQPLGVLPVPNKPGSIFLGWYTDNGRFANAVSAYTTVTCSLKLYARWVAIGGVPEADEVTSISAMDCEPGFAIHVVSSNTGMSAADVQAALQLEVVDGTPFAGLSVTGSGGAYVVTALEGYTRGSSYKLTLTNTALTFDGEPASARTYCFTIKQTAMDNLELAPEVIEMPAGDIGDITVNGAAATTLSVPLAVTGADLSTLGATGTFTYLGSHALAVGDLLAIYEGTPPGQRDPAGDYSDEAVAYVEVTAIDGNTVTYRSAEAKDVLFKPDVLPVDPALDLDGDAANHSITIPIADMTYAGPDFAAIGLNENTVVEPGDFLAFETGTTEADAAVAYAQIDSVMVSGGDYVIAYHDVTEAEMNAAMDIYSSHEEDFGDTLQQADVAAMEASIEQQAIDSGFAEQAAGYLTDLATKTDGFQSLTGATVQAAAAGGSGPTISNLQVSAQISTTLTHFPGLSGLHCGVTVSFDVGFGDNLNLHLSGTFVEEVRVSLHASGHLVWGWKQGPIIKRRYIADYRMTGNVDLYNFTGIDVRATLTTSAGDSSPLDIAQEIRDMMSASNYLPEQISADTQAFYELYADMLAQDHDYVQIFKQQISHVETAIDPLHILVAGLTLEFVVNADVDVSLGAHFAYEKGTRYVFTLNLFSKTATSDKVDLVDENYDFQFYVMGTLGLRAGVVARVEMGLFSLNLDSIGLELELGPYVRLWGFFFYELRYANHVRTSTTSGAMYVELGIYLETRFLAQVLNGKYSYNPTLYSNEWPLWTAGSRYNVYDFAYNLTDATDDIRLKGATRTYALPACALGMKQLDLKEGDVSTTSHTSSEFTITFTNSSFAQTAGTIRVAPPAGQHIVEGYMTINWNGAPLSFTSVPISRTYHLVWDDLASSYMISFNTQGGSSVSPIVGAYGSTVTLPAPTRVGYSFGGWFTNAAGTGTAYTAATMPAANVQLYAKWTANTNTAYTVRHFQQALAGTYVLTATQALAGTTGSQVTPGANTYPGFTAPATQTVTIAGDGSTAVAYNYTRNSYQATFHPNNGGTDTVNTVKFGALVVTVSVSRLGYTFAGWYDNAGFTGAAYTTTSTMPAANLQLWAKWTANTNTPYTVKHYQETVAGSFYALVATQAFTGTTGAQVTPAVNTYAGFTAPATQTVTITGDGTTIVSYNYSRNGYLLTCHPNNGQADTTSTVKYGATLVLPTVTRLGYTFAGWYDNAGLTGSVYTATSTMPAAPLQLYAKWTANTGTAYTVKHYKEILAGTLYSLFETETLYGTTGSQVTPPVKTYEGFTAPVTQTVTIAGDGSTVVEYQYHRNTYDFSTYPNNGDPDHSGTLRYGATLNGLTVTKAGNTFGGWYENDTFTGDPFTGTTMPARTLTLYAKWIPIVELPVSISTQLSNPVEGKALLGDHVHDTITLEWAPEAGAVPTGTLKVTMVTPTRGPDDPYVVCEEVITPTTSPFTFTTTDQGLSELGLYQFRAEYIPDAESHFAGATSAYEEEQLTVVGDGWYEGFDTCVAGSAIVGQGGWQNSAFSGSTPLTVSTTQSRSGDNSLELAGQPGATDQRVVVHPCPAMTSGAWEVTAWWFIPDSPDPDVRAYFWFGNDSSGNRLSCYGTTLSAPGDADTQIVTGDWVPIRFKVDLTNHYCQIYYNNDLLHQGEYTGTGIEFAVASLPEGTTTYLDDVSVMPTTMVY